jgi:hypothetical protein
MNSSIDVFKGMSEGNAPLGAPSNSKSKSNDNSNDPHREIPDHHAKPYPA